MNRRYHDFSDDRRGGGGFVFGSFLVVVALTIAAFVVLDNARAPGETAARAFSLEIGAIAEIPEPVVDPITTASTDAAAVASRPSRRMSPTRSGTDRRSDSGRFDR